MNSIEYRGQSYNTTENNRTLTSIIEKATCGICKSLFSQPVEACANHHIYCRRCITEWQIAVQDCPSCRSPLHNDLSTRETERSANVLIDLITVQCPQNCGSDLSLTDIEIHQSETCPKKEHWCPLLCGQKMFRSQLEEHQRIACDHRLTQCDDCLQQYRLNSRKRHLAFYCPQPLQKKAPDGNDTKPDTTDLTKLLQYARENCASLTPSMTLGEQVLDAFRKHLFSATLNQAQLNEQLALLKDLDATVDILPARSFSEVIIINLASYETNPAFLDQSGLIFSQQGSSAARPLILLTGSYNNQEDWLSLEGGTFIGSLTPIKISGRNFYPNTPRAVIKGDSNNNSADKNKNWSCTSGRADESCIRSAQDQLGWPPHVVLRDASLMGITIECSNEQGILVLVSTSQTVSHCQIHNTMPHGITLYKSSDITLHSNSMIPAAGIASSELGIVHRYPKGSGL
ncbi:hypothetical protein [Parendozoicomonas haliclonae]|uniref:RING-type domain-containing protein n=1 Tax=Parendozoicomonas haliclonae TaxID=1960125 RepID=A0A1X7AEF1_9GAMM|nr:hypothetical protein [Parendozoicomonas haliclonae]SMA33169.1 hypothetical protein EHSB41UT_00235 [Parendozoicomonas haliclonae]